MILPSPLQSRRIRLVVAAIAFVMVVTIHQAWQNYRVRTMRDAIWPNAVRKGVDSLLVASEGEPVDAVRKGGAWYLRLPGRPLLRADPGRIEGFLRFIYNNKPVRRIGRIPGESRTRYGLDAPRARIAIGPPVAWELTVGDDAPGHDGVYAASSLEPEMLLILDQEYVQQAVRGSVWFEDLRLVNIDSQKVTRFRFRDEQGRGFSVKRPEKGSYVFSWPEELTATPVDASLADLWLHELATMKAADLLDHVPPVGAPVFTVEVWLEDGGQERVEVYRTGDAEGAGGAWLGHSSWQPVYFALDQESVNRLQISSFAIRDRRFLGAIGLDAARVDLERDGGRLVAIQGEDGWTDEAGTREFLGIDTLLWRLRDTRYEEEPVQALPPDARQEFVCRFADDNGKPLASVAFYISPSGPPERCWIKVGLAEQYYPVPSRLLHDMLSSVPSR